MVDGFSCILDFPKFSGGGGLLDHPYKGTTPVTTSISFLNNNNSKGKTKTESPPTLKQSARKFIFKQDFLHWIIQKLAKIYQHFKE